MTIEEQRIFQDKWHSEAMRYMSNAEEILKKSPRSDSYYDDPKYVRSACGTAYVGVLVALDAWLTLKGVTVPMPSDKKRGTLKSNIRKKQIDFYRTNLATMNRKLLDHLSSVYQILHLDGYYDGARDADLIRLGFKRAYEIIDTVKSS